MHSKQMVVTAVCDFVKFNYDKKIKCTFLKDSLSTYSLSTIRTMKRVVDFQEQDKEADFEFKDNKDNSKKQKKNQNEKFNAKTKRLDHAEFKKKKQEMLEFRKQLPIYSGEIDI